MVRACVFVCVRVCVSVCEGGEVFVCAFRLLLDAPVRKGWRAVVEGQPWGHLRRSLLQAEPHEGLWGRG